MASTPIRSRARSTASVTIRRVTGPGAGTHLVKSWSRGSVEGASPSRRTKVPATTSAEP